MINRDRCAICAFNSFEKLYIVERVPISMVAVETVQKETATYQFVRCEKCSCIQLGKLISLKKLYQNNHNLESLGNVWKEHYEKLSQFINQIGFINNVLEFADPSFKLAKHLSNYKQWYIIEPNFNTKIECPKNVKPIKGWFDEKFSLEQYNIPDVDLVVHSHFFEHLYDPTMFCHKIFNLLKVGGHMIFSVPNMEKIAEKGMWPFLGVFFEHTYHLTRSNVEYMLEEAGFCIKEVQYYKEHSIFFHCIKEKNYLQKSSLKGVKMYNEKYYKLFKQSLREYEEMIKILNEKLEKIDTVYLYGCHYISQILLMMGLNQSKIVCLLDNAVSKQNKYLFGTKFITKSPKIIKNIVNPNIIVHMGMYTDEIKEQLLQINNTVNFLI